MTQVRITEITGGTYPIDVYISDVYGNHQTLLGTINPGPVPPIVEYNTVIPSIFQTAKSIIRPELKFPIFLIRLTEIVLLWYLLNKNT